MCCGDEARDGAGHPELVATAPRQPVQPATTHDEPAALKAVERGEPAAVMNVSPERDRMRIPPYQR